MTVEKIVTTPTPLGVTDKINEVITELEGITDSTFQGYWEAGETVEVGDVRYLTGRDNTGYVLECVGAGVTGSEQPDVDISDIGSETAENINNFEGTLSIEKGGTDASTAEEACANIGALPLSGGTMTGNININDRDFWLNHSTEHIANRTVVSGGNNSGDGATLYLNGGERSAFAGCFDLRPQTDTENTGGLMGYPNGSLTWRGTALTIKTGDILTFTDVVCIGYITSDTKNLYIFVPFTKAIAATSCVVNSFTCSVRQNGSYIVTQQNISSYVNNFKINTNGIQFVFREEDAWNASNNAECAIQIHSATITFS